MPHTHKHRFQFCVEDELHEVTFHLNVTTTNNITTNAISKVHCRCEATTNET